MESVKSAAYLALTLLGFLGLHGYMVEQEIHDLESKLATERAHSDHTKQTLAHVLNSEPVADQATGEVYFIEVSVQKGLE